MKSTTGKINQILQKMNKRREKTHQKPPATEIIKRTVMKEQRSGNIERKELQQ